MSFAGAMVLCLSVVTLKVLIKHNSVALFRLKSFLSRQAGNESPVYDYIRPRLNPDQAAASGVYLNDDIVEERISEASEKSTDHPERPYAEIDAFELFEQGQNAGKSTSTTNF